MTSHHPEDVKYGYCGNCHEFTSEGTVKNTRDEHDPFTDAGAIEAGRIAYQAYGQATRFRNFQGDPMPDWGSLSDQIQQAWAASAQAVAKRVLMSAFGGMKQRQGDAGPVTGRQDF
jgi:hypothetical protein